MAENNENKPTWKQVPSSASAPWFNGDSGLFLKSGQNAKGNSVLQIQFWRKGEKFGDNKDDMVSIPMDLVYNIDKALCRIMMGENGRITQWKKGSKDYELLNNYEWFLIGRADKDGINKAYATIRIDTVDVDGVSRVRFSLIKGERVNSVVFYDKFADQNSHTENPVRGEYDVAETSLVRFCAEWHLFIKYSAWVLPALSSLYNAILGNRSIGNNGGNKPSYNNNNYRKENYSSKSSSTNELGFDDDDM